MKLCTHGTHLKVYSIYKRKSRNSITPVHDSIKFSTPYDGFQTNSGLAKMFPSRVYLYIKNIKYHGTDLRSQRDSFIQIFKLLYRCVQVLHYVFLYL